MSAHSMAKWKPEVGNYLGFPEAKDDVLFSNRSNPIF